jgi:hypothetical protein
MVVSTFSAACRFTAVEFTGQCFRKKRVVLSSILSVFETDNLLKALWSVYLRTCTPEGKTECLRFPGWRLSFDPAECVEEWIEKDLTK